MEKRTTCLGWLTLSLLLLQAGCGPSTAERAQMTVAVIETGVAEANRATSTQRAIATGTQSALDAAAAESATQSAIETEAAEKTATQEAKGTARADERLTATVQADEVQLAVQRLYHNIPTQESVDHFLEVIESNVRVIGPTGGNLNHHIDNFITVDCSGSPSALNMVMTAVFKNPYPTSTAPWDYGFLFRNNRSNNQFRMELLSTGNWALVSGTSQGDTWTYWNVAGQYTALLDRNSNAQNRLTVIAIEDKGFLMVNDQYITQLDLTRHLTERGYICVATGFEVGDEREGETTVYSDFRQWKLPRLDKLQ